MRKALIILGVPVDSLTMESALSRLESFIAVGRATGRSHQVATINADFVVNALHDPDLRRILQEADMATADGTPLVWGARLLGVQLEGRVTGVDMVQALAERAAQQQYSFFLLGGMPGVADQAAEILQQRYPDLKIAGVLAPPHGPVHSIDPSVLEAIKAARPDILLVAFGNPKQEKFINMYARELGVPVCIGVGGTLDMIAGVAKRAPLWMQRFGLEWLFRLCQEPGRLWKRYVRDLTYFGGFFLRQWWTMRPAPAPAEPPLEAPPVLVERSTVIAVQGRLDVSNQDAFAARAESLLSEYPHLVVDLRAATFLDSSALGLLVSLANRARAAGGSLALSAVPPTIAQILRLVQLDSFFDIYADTDAALTAQQTHELAFVPSPDVQSGWQVVRIPRTLDTHAAQALLEHGQAALTQNPRLILDCGETTLIASAGLAVMSKLGRMAIDRGGQVRVAACSQAIRKSIELVHLDSVVPTYQDVCAAAA